MRPVHDRQIRAALMIIALVMGIYGFLDLLAFKAGYGVVLMAGGSLVLLVLVFDKPGEDADG